MHLTHLTVGYEFFRNMFLFALAKILRQVNAESPRKLQKLFRPVYKIADLIMRYGLARGQSTMCPTQLRP